MTAEERSFLSRPAIVWDEQLVEGNENGRKCDYWNIDFLLDLFHDETSDGSEAGVASLSYKSLLMVAAFVVQIIQRELQDLLRSKHLFASSGQGQVLAVPIAVAIPEGPFLPLAIIAVHALNIPFSLDNNGHHAYAVLVPIEPGEGKDRIRHMLADTRAVMILCFEVDRQRLTDIVDTLQCHDPNILSLSAGTVLYKAVAPRIIDFAEIVSQAVEQIRSVSPQTLSHICRCFDESQNLQLSIAQSSQFLLDNSNVLDESIICSNRISHIAYTSGEICFYSCQNHFNLIDPTNLCFIG